MSKKKEQKILRKKLDELFVDFASLKGKANRERLQAVIEEKLNDINSFQKILLAGHKTRKKNSTEEAASGIQLPVLHEPPTFFEEIQNSQDHYQQVTEKEPAFINTASQ